MTDFVRRGTEERFILLLLHRSQGSFLFLSSDVWVNIPISSISFVDHFEVPRNFALNALISLTLHLAFLFKLLSSLLHIVN